MSRPVKLGLVMRRPHLALVFAVLVAIVGVSGILVAAGVVGRPSTAGDGEVVIWAVTALPDGRLVAVGGTDDVPGGLVEAVSNDDGITWAVSRPGPPAFTAVSAAGTRLVGATNCVIQIHQAGESVVTDVPGSCLYESADGGRTWHDMGQGLIDDPSFVDGSHGFGHSPADERSQEPQRLYSTNDGGHSWVAHASPCDSTAPVLVQSVAISANTAAVLCTAGADSATWEIVELDIASSSSTVVARVGTNGAPDIELFRFAMRPGGLLLLFGDDVYRSADYGATWMKAGSPGAGVRVLGGAFTSDRTGYFAIANVGIFSGIAKTDDGGWTWRELIRWPYFG